jgi:opacity protein-like surface antigen
MSKIFSVIIYLFLLLALFHFPVRAQSYSLEIGYLHNSILMDGGYGALCDYRDHGTGLHLGFNIHNQHNTTINFQLSCTDFIYTPHPDSFRDFFNNKNTYFYDVAVKFRTNLLRGTFRPFFLIGPGMHFIHWGDLYDPVVAEQVGAIEAYAPEWNLSSQFYFNLGAGVEFKVYNNFDLVLEGSWTFSKSFYFSPIIMALKYNL